MVIALGNRTEFVTSYLGALRAGLVAVPVNPRSATGELVRLVADCGARVVIADVASLATVRQAVEGLQDALAGADEELRRATVVPRVVVVAAPRRPGRRRTPTCSPPRAPTRRSRPTPSRWRSSSTRPVRRDARAPRC